MRRRHVGVFVELGRWDHVWPREVVHRARGWTSQCQFPFPPPIKRLVDEDRAPGMMCTNPRLGVATASAPVCSGRTVTARGTASSGASMRPIGRRPSTTSWLSAGVRRDSRRCSGLHGNHRPRGASCGVRPRAPRLGSLDHDRHQRAAVRRRRGPDPEAECSETAAVGRNRSWWPGTF